MLKMAKKVTHRSDLHVNGTAQSASEYVGPGDDHVMMFDVHDVVDLAVADVMLSKSQPKTDKGELVTPPCILHPRISHSLANLLSCLDLPYRC